MNLIVEEGSALLLPKLISFDTETTGLMPYHGGRIFAISLSDGENNYYIRAKPRLPQFLVDFLAEPTNCIVGHNIKFDLHFLAKNYGMLPKCRVIDTLSLARLEFNDHLSYGLDACAARIGLKKDDAVEKYITEHKLWEWETIPGKKVRKKNKFYDKVPEKIMVEYACMDAEVTYKLYQHLTKRISQIDALLPDAPKLAAVSECESDLLKVVQSMEAGGVKVDLEYSRMALDFYQGEAKRAEEEFEKITGQKYKASPKMFAEIFASEKDKWAYTEKGNPSFDSDAIQRFDNPAAKQILILRDAKSRSDFFASFDFYADSKDFIHPSFNQSGTATGRFSSSEPNFQNQTNDEEAEEGTLGVREAITPCSPDHCIVSFDYDQQEYRMMLDYAGELELIEQVKAGVDVHEATAKMMGVSRKYAKTLNFMLLYGGGVGKLAEALKIPEWEAKSLRDLYFSRLPKVQKFIQTVIATARQRGYVYNWAGRRYFCDPDFAYKMPNRIIQGGGADVLKRAMIEINKLLHGTSSYLFMTVHDELDFYIHKNDMNLVPKIKEIMEKSYPHKLLPLTVSISHSWENLGALKDGAPTPLEVPHHNDRPPALRSNKGLSDKDELLRCFGIRPKDVKEFKQFRVEENLSNHTMDLIGTRGNFDHKLATADKAYLAYSAKQFEVDLDIFRG